MIFSNMPAHLRAEAASLPLHMAPNQPAQTGRSSSRVSYKHLQSPGLWGEQVCETLWEENKRQNLQRRKKENKTGRNKEIK